MVLCALILAVVGLMSLIFAAFDGAAPLWGLAALSLLSGGLAGWGAQRQWEATRQAAPDQLMSRRDLARYAFLATGVVVLTLVIHGLGALAS